MVHERPTRIARIDGRVGLDHAGDCHASVPLNLSVQSRHHPRSEGLIQPKRVADGDGLLANNQPTVIWESAHRNQMLFGSVNLQHGQVSTRLTSYQRRGIALLILKRDAK